MCTYLASHVYILSYTNNTYVLFQILQWVSSTAAEPHTKLHSMLPRGKIKLLTHRKYVDRRDQLYLPKTK